MRKEKQRFSAEDFLNVYNVVRLQRGPNTNIHTRNHYSRLRNNKEPYSRLVFENLDKDVLLDDFDSGN